MLEYNFEGKNIFNPLENRMQEVIDTFVSFYGEEYRERITDRLSKNKVYFLGRENEASIESSIKALFKERTDKLFKKFVKSIDVKLTNYYSPSKFVFALENLDNKLYKINDYPLRILLTELGFVNAKCSKDEIDKLKQNGQFFSEFKLLVSSIQQKWDKEFQNEYNDLKEQEQFVLDDTKRLCKKTQNFDYFAKLKSILDENAKKHGFELNDDVLVDQQILSTIELFIVLNSRLTFELFNKGLQPYFKSIGYKDGFADFDQYLQDEKLITFLKDKTLLAEIEKLKIEQEKSKFADNIFYKEFVRDIQNEGKICNINNVILNAIDYIIGNNGSAYMQPVVKKDIFYTRSILPQALALNDLMLFHEFTHVIESDFKRETNGELSYKVGFTSRIYKENYEEFDENQIIKLKKDNDEIAFKSPNNEEELETAYKVNLLNEVVTDYLSCKVYDKWTKSHSSIGFLLNKEDTTYSVAFPLLSKFLDENLDLIIQCRMSQDADAFRKMIGEEYYRKLYNSTFEYSEIVLNNPSILDAISKKTGLNKNNLYNCYKYDCNWTDKEKVIVDAYSKIEEISKVVTLRKEFDNTQKSKKSTNKKNKNNYLDREI